MGWDIRALAAIVRPRRYLSPPVSPVVFWRWLFRIMRCLKTDDGHERASVGHLLQSLNGDVPCHVRSMFLEAVFSFIFVEETDILVKAVVTLITNKFFETSSVFDRNSLVTVRPNMPFSDKPRSITRSLEVLHETVLPRREGAGVVGGPKLEPISPSHEVHSERRTHWGR
jgi:hypothetical protein